MKKKLIFIPIALLLAFLGFNAQIFEYVPGWVEAGDGLTVTVSADSNNPIGGDTVKDTRGLTFLQFQFEVPSQDGIVISSLVFRVYKNGSKYAQKEDIRNFRLYDENNQQLSILGKGDDPIKGKVVIDDLGLYVPRDATKTLTLRADIGGNSNAQKVRVVLDKYVLGLSNIVGQNSEQRPKIVGSAIGNDFVITDKLIHITQPWHGLNWQVGQQYRIGWNNRGLVNNLSLALIGYQSMDEDKPGKSYPIVNHLATDPKSSFGGYNYTVPQSMIEDLGRYKYFRVGASYELPMGNNQVKLFDSYSSGFFTITAPGSVIPVPDSEIVRAYGDHKVYKIINGRRLWIPSVEIFYGLGYKPSDIKQISQAKLNSIPQAKLLKAILNSKIYYITDSGLKRHILSDEVFNSYQDQWEDIVEVPQGLIDAYEDNTLIRREGNWKVFKIENGVKRWVKTLDMFNQEGFDWSKVAPVNSVELRAYTTGMPIE